MTASFLVYLIFIVFFSVTGALRSTKNLHYKNIHTVERNPDERRDQRLGDEVKNYSSEEQHGIGAILLLQPKKMQRENKIIYELFYKMTKEVEAKKSVSAAESIRMDFLRSYKRKSCTKKCKRAESIACNRKDCERKLKNVVVKSVNIGHINISWRYSV